MTPLQQKIRTRLNELVPKDKCEKCFGTGKEICDNPDHGILDLLSFRGADKSICPCCGHSEDHTIENSVCPDCQPQLADVLRAIDKKYKGDLFATVASNGWVHLGNTRAFFDLTKSVLDQDTEFQEWLWEVIKK